MKTNAVSPKIHTQARKSATAPAAKEETNFVKDFFTYTPREADSHEPFFYRLGQDFVHSIPFTAKGAGVGAAGGLLLGAAVGAMVAVPVIGGIAGIVAATRIVEKATDARNMKELAGIAGWTS